MSHKPPLTLAAPAQHLHHLMILRALVLAGLSVSLLLLMGLTQAELPVAPLVAVLFAMASLNLMTLMRLRQALPVAEFEFFVQLLLDVGLLSLLFYYSGGANNPFVSYFLVPICISAATLTWSRTWLLTGLCILSFSLLLFWHVPLPAISPGESHAHSHHRVLDLHVLGMWLNFFISAVLITYFVVRMARDLRQRDEQLNQQREDNLRDEQVMAVATLAAGTAHELGTPLSTMKVLLSELKAEYPDQINLQSDLRTLSNQVDQCAQTLRELVATAEQTREGQFPPQSLREYCHHVIDRWLVMRPDVRAHIQIAESLQDQQLALHPTIAQSITNLLNNAADANPEAIEVTVTWNTDTLDWHIADKGPGIPLDMADRLGKVFITNKGSGLGLGLFLTHATINRYGGQVRRYNRPEGGTLTELTLPLKEFTP